MKIVLVAIDSKYIHTNMAIRYLKANLDYESTLKEFTIKDDFEFIESSILSETPDIIAFSVYLWNVEIILKLTREIKSKINSFVIFGGPEVSYEPEYFIKNSHVDYIISGEGEISFNLLVNAINQNQSLSSIPGLTYRKNDEINRNKSNEILNLNLLKNPYHFPEDINNLATKIQYIEMSRGCPFHCSYCLASLEKNIRFFDIERVKNDILYLMNHGAKTFKFLDRTFNYKIEYALSIFDFIIKNHLPRTQFQFEITGDLLPRKIIDFINENAPKGLFRFEIGIQSTNELTNLSVDRHQNNDKLFNNILLIQKANIIDLHLDLIAGLPFENLSRFSKTFDDVFSLYPKELQLGFLKMLRGTKIRNEAEKYRYLYDPRPPYEMISNQDLSKEDLNVIHRVEDVLEVFWNKGFMSDSLKTIFQNEKSIFQFMLDFSCFLQENHFNFHRYQLHDLFILLNEFLFFSNRNNDQILFELIDEYLHKSKIKPHIWWKCSVTKHLKTQIYNKVVKNNADIKIDDLYKYGIVINQNTMHRIYVFYPDNLKIIDVNL